MALAVTVWLQMLSQDEWKGYLKLLQFSVAGLEMTFLSWGLAGMGSASQLVVFAYLHYCYSAKLLPVPGQATWSASSSFMQLFPWPVSASATSSPTPIFRLGVHTVPSSGQLPVFDRGSIFAGLNTDQLALEFLSVMHSAVSPTTILISHHNEPATPPILRPAASDGIPHCPSSSLTPPCSDLHSPLVSPLGIPEYPLSLAGCSCATRCFAYSPLPPLAATPTLPPTLPRFRQRQHVSS
ncbi:uncharacterized protein LOC129599858 [Paramacrobiotus metropolitanus]|uniref:uncharacterized protein LOC129599858 n=1 Tax=Paramacrobiotus metropolitanus TaxID=2943436 RepID=UPI002445854E|nr:uncharacterized protein LOC129599858 [Paramacrobiotus metropolitanus]